MKTLRMLAKILMTTIMDFENLFSNDQAVTDTAISTNDVYLGPVQDGDGAGRKVLIAVTEDFATLTSLTFGLYGSDTAADATPTNVLTKETTALADLVAGARFEIPIPANFGYKYATVKYTVVGTTATAGKVTAGIVLATDTNS